MTKALVLFWSYANVFPWLTPIILFAAFFGLAHLLRNQLEGLHSGLLFLIACALTGFVTYKNYEEGPRIFFEYISKNGSAAEAKVISVSGDRVEMKFKYPDDSETEVSYTPESRRFYPPIELPVEAPDVGDEILLRYYPDVPNAFIVVIDPRQSTYGKKIACKEGARVLNLADKAFRIDSFPTTARRANYKAAIESVLSMACFDTSERDRYREILLKL